MDDRTRLMLEKLKDQSARGCIPNTWAEEFIWSLDEQRKAGRELTAKQLVKVEELFEQY